MIVCNFLKLRLLSKTLGSIETIVPTGINPPSSSTDLNSISPLASLETAILSTPGFPEAIFNESLTSTFSNSESTKTSNKEGSKVIRLLVDVDHLN